jgi:hypothetical protein
MGYDLHVHRGDEWSDLPPDAEISLEEWRAYVAGATDLRMDDAVETQSPTGEVIRMESPGLTTWTGAPGGGPVIFDFRGGRVVVANPDEPTIARLGEVARALGARVQGDEGEFYGGT